MAEQAVKMYIYETTVTSLLTTPSSTAPGNPANSKIPTASHFEAFRVWLGSIHSFLDIFEALSDDEFACLPTPFFANVVWACAMLLKTSLAINSPNKAVYQLLFPPELKLGEHLDKISGRISAYGNTLEESVVKRCCIGINVFRDWTRNREQNMDIPRMQNQGYPSSRVSTPFPPCFYSTMCADLGFM